VDARNSGLTSTLWPRFPGDFPTSALNARTEGERR
jgi:hypothetical protein